MSDLILNVKTEYFNEIKSGQKIKEYRLVNDYWNRRLAGKKFDNVIIRLGYSKAGDSSREMIFQFRGYDIETISHKHFGEKPVQVYAIILEK